MRVNLTDSAIDALARDPMMLHAVEPAARAVAAQAKAEAPVVTGHYRDSINAGDAELGLVVQAQVGSDDLGAVAIEFGSVNNPAYAPFTKAVRAVGLTLRQSR